MKKVEMRLQVEYSEELDEQSVAEIFDMIALAILDVDKRMKQQIDESVRVR